MSILKEFKSFAMRGNVVDMAIGIIIGASFGKIISSLVNDVLMPPIGMLLGGVDFSYLSITLKSASEGVSAVVVRYGAFINTVIDFLIVAFCMFIVVKGMNKLKRAEEKPPEAPPKLSKEAELLTEIKELLKNK